jgi:hypothetical protein
MKNKTKKFSYFLSFFIAGFSLLAGMMFINPAKSARQVSAEDTNEYYITGDDSINGWDITNTEFPLEKIGNYQFKYEGELGEGAAGVKFKITWGQNWANAYGYSNVDSGSHKYFYDDGGNIKIAAKNTGVLILLDTSNGAKISGSIEVVEMPNIVQSHKGGINLDYMRVWLDRGMYESAGALNALQYGAQGTLTDESTIYEASGYVKLFEGEEGGHWEHWLAYFDIPTASLTAGMDIRVARVNNLRSAIWNKTEVHTWSVGDNNKVLYVGDNWDATTLSPGIIGDDKEIPVDFLKHVLEGYLTCSPSTINGYGAFPEMNRTFFKDADGEWKIVGLLDEVMLDDYASMDTSYTGERVEESVDAYEKYLKMEALYLASSGGSGAPNIFATNNSITFVVLISIIGITSLAALYFLKKKKVA